jgi:HK97 family phage portal protein
MGVLSRLLGRRAPTEERAGGSWTMPSYSFGHSGASLADVKMAESLSAVSACVSAIASGVSSLPATVFQDTPGGRIAAPNHPVSRLIRRPNPNTTWPDVIEWLIGQTLLYGNGLLRIVSDGAGRPVALIPVPWQAVTVVMLPTGVLAYDVVASGGPSGYTGPALPGRLLADDVLHLRDRSDDGLVGRSRISRAPDVIAAAHELQVYSASVWQNAAAPSGLITFSPANTPEGRKRQADQFIARTTGAANAGRLMFLEGDTKYAPLACSPEDAETLASRQFSVIELCRLFGVPPPIIQAYENNTFTNAATAEQWFAQRTLLPWVAKLEAEFARSVFSDPSYSLTLDMGSLIRGDYATMMATNTAAVAAGIITRDEAREAAGYGPMADDTD